MTFSPINSLAYFLEENIEFSQKPEEMSWQLKEFINTNARATNARDIGIYNTQEIIIGQKYFSSDPLKFKDVFRIVIDTGQLPNSGTKQVAHGLTNVDNNWFFTRIYGAARQPAGAAPQPRFIPIPNAGPTYPIEVWVDITNVNLNTTVDLSSFTSSIIVLEYYKF